jgi:hypothetical protein
MYQVDITESHTLTMELAARNEEIKLKELQHQRMISEVEGLCYSFNG